MSARHPVRRRSPIPVALALLLAVSGAALFSACGGAPRDEEIPANPREIAAAERAALLSRLPDALMVRFSETSGTGFAREGWELEILQMGEDVRVQGSFRHGNTAVPIYRPMGPIDYSELWDWLSEFPLDSHQVQVDETVADADWKKSLEIDVVLGQSDRWISRNTWTRPLAPGEPVREIEARLHDMILDLAEEEVARMSVAVDTVGATGAAGLDEGVRRAIEALGDAAPENLPGGISDLE